MILCPRLRISVFYLLECPDGYVNGVHSLQCYKVITQTNSWNTQKALCEADNAYLAELVEHTERTAVYNYMAGKYEHLKYTQPLILTRCWTQIAIQYKVLS